MHGVASGCEAEPSAVHNEFLGPQNSPKGGTCIFPITAVETEPQGTYVIYPAPHKGPDLESVGLQRLCLSR